MSTAIKSLVLQEETCLSDDLLEQYGQAKKALTKSRCLLDEVIDQSFELLEQIQCSIQDKYPNLTFSDLELTYDESYDNDDSDEIVESDTQESFQGYGFQFSCSNVNIALCFLVDPDHTNVYWAFLQLDEDSYGAENAEYIYNNLSNLVQNSCNLTTEGDISENLNEENEFSENAWICWGYLAFESEYNEFCKLIDGVIQACNDNDVFSFDIKE